MQSISTYCILYILTVCKQVSESITRKPHVPLNTSHLKHPKATRVWKIHMRNVQKPRDLKHVTFEMSENHVIFNKSHVKRWKKQHAFLGDFPHLKCCFTFENKIIQNLTINTNKTKMLCFCVQHGFSHALFHGDIAACCTEYKYVAHHKAADPWALNIVTETRFAEDHSLFTEDELVFYSYAAQLQQEAVMSLPVSIHMVQ